MSTFFKRFDIRVGLIYFLVAAFWIIASDTLVTTLLSDSPHLLSLINLFKGMGFVVATTVSLFLVVSLEMRKRLKIENALQQEHDISPVGIIILTQQGKVRYANNQAMDLLGLLPRHLNDPTYDDPIWHVTDYEGRPFPREQLPFAQVMKQRKPVYGVQHAITRTDGTRLLLQINAAPLFASDGTIYEVVATFSDVTTFIQNTKRLHESEERYRLLVEQSPYAIGIHQADRIVFANQSAAHLLGAAHPHDLIGLPIANILHPERREAVMDRRRQMLSGETGLYPTEECYVRLDGIPIDVEITAAPFVYQGQAAVQVIALDITTRKQAEKALRDSEEQYRLLVEQAADGIFVANAQGQYIQVNQRGCDMLGYTRSELLSMHMQDLISSDDLAVEPFQLQTLQTGKTVTTERQLRCKDGHFLPVEISACMLPNGQMQGIVHDLTQRKQSEEHLRYQANLIESVSDAIISTDVAFNIRSWNKAAERLYGWKAEEVLGKSVSQVLPASNLDRAQAFAELHSSGLWRGEVTQPHQDGRMIHILSSVSLNYDTRGKPIGVVGINRDITERKNAEDALYHYNQRLTLLHHIDRDIITTRSPNTIIETVVRQIRQLIPCERASVVLLDETSKNGVIVAANRATASTLNTNIILSGGTPLTDRLKEGQVIMIDDLQEQASLKSHVIETVIQEGVRSVLIAPLIIQDEIVGYFNLGAMSPGFFTSLHGEIAGEIANQIAIALHSTRLMKALQTNNQQLQILSARLVEAQEKERQHIARELHDEVGQTLTALSLILDVQARQSQTTKDNGNLNEAQTLVSDLMKRIRELSLDLRPSMLDDLGLIPTLIWYFKRYEQQTRIAIDFKYRSVEGRFSSIIETTLYRMIQEALTNIARHARVDEAFVQVWATRDVIYAQIEDGGIGFDLEAAQSKNQTGGLLGLRERAQIAGGQCSIESSPGSGTIISVSIPLAPDT